MQKLKIGIIKIKIGYRKIEHKCNKNQGCQEKIKYRYGKIKLFRKIFEKIKHQYNKN